MNFSTGRGQEKKESKGFDWRLPEPWKWFKSPVDILRLGIIDIGRTNNYWPNEGAALDRVHELLGDHKAAYLETVAEDFGELPDVEGWTGWNHHGQTSHEAIARDLYNWFAYHHPGAEIAFLDEPDFQVRRPDGMTITGDIGRVAVSTFIFAILNIKGGDWWMSVTDDGKRHVIILVLSDVAGFSNKEWPQ